MNELKLMRQAKHGDVKILILLLQRPTGSTVSAYVENS